MDRTHHTHWCFTEIPQSALLPLDGRVPARIFQVYPSSTSRSNDVYKIVSGQIATFLLITI